MSTIISASPAKLYEAAGWRPFLDQAAGVFYGWHVDELDDDAGCTDPWSVNLRTGVLTQCGCDEFTPGPVPAEVAAVLARIDLTPIPRPTAWRYFDQCDPIHGCGYRGGWWLDAITRSVIPCPCGWDPTRLHEWEVGR